MQNVILNKGQEQLQGMIEIPVTCNLLPYSESKFGIKDDSDQGGFLGGIKWVSKYLLELVGKG